MTRSLFVCAALLIAVPASEMQASPFKQANEYFQVRDRAQVQDSYTAEDIQTRPDAFAGKLLEVRGVVSAAIESSTEARIVVGSSGVTAATTVAFPPGRALAEWPFVTINSAVRVLCKVVTTEESPNGFLEAVIAVKEYEAASVDRERDAIAAKVKQQEDVRNAIAARRAAPAGRLSSRGSFSASAARSNVRVPPSQLVPIYASAVRYFNRRLSPGQATRIASSILEYSVRYGLDARLVMAVIAVESNFNQNAVSPVGARGLGQLMPGTASDLGVYDSFDLRANLEGSTRLLRTHLDNMSPDNVVSEKSIRLALACYNAGAGAVKKYRGIPPYRETQNYVKKITRLYRQMCGLDA